MNELLFECYSVPKVCYGTDALFSRKANDNAISSSTNLVVSLGFHSVHVIPVIDGAVSLDGLRRINVGGFQMISYLQRLLQLKYPAHAANITVSSAFKHSEEDVYNLRNFSLVGLRR